jgi:hypothetical protein
VTRGGDPYRARVWREAGSSGAYADMDADVLAPDASLRDLDPETPHGYPATGTVADVLAWTGPSPDRAAYALAAERRREAPRQGILGPLTRMVE